MDGFGAIVVLVNNNLRKWSLWVDTLKQILELTSGLYG